MTSDDSIIYTRQSPWMNSIWRPLGFHVESRWILNKIVCWSLFQMESIWNLWGSVKYKNFLFGIGWSLWISLPSLPYGLRPNESAKLLSFVPMLVIIWFSGIDFKFSDCLNKLWNFGFGVCFSTSWANDFIHELKFTWFSPECRGFCWCQCKFNKSVFSFNHSKQ